jgi:hypothetical protein
MRARFQNDENTLNQWSKLRKELNDFSGLRNEIAHLIPRPKYSRDQNAVAVVRLVPPFWKPAPGIEFEERGFSWIELSRALAPFWGFDPSLNIAETSNQRLSYRLDQFTQNLKAPAAAAALPSAS